MASTVRKGRLLPEYRNCLNKIRLLREYLNGLIEWSRANRSLTNLAHQDDFAIQMHKLDQARAQAELANAKYNNQVAEHGSGKVGARTYPSHPVSSSTRVPILLRPQQFEQRLQFSIRELVCQLEEFFGGDFLPCQAV